MKYAVLAGFLLGVLLCGAPLEAQVAADAEKMAPSPAVGARSLAFTLNGNGSATLGFWRMKSETKNVGWEIRLDASQSGGSSEPKEGSGAENSATDIVVTLGPSFRRYVQVGQPVVPFVQTGVDVGFSYSRNRTEILSDSGEKRVWREHATQLRGVIAAGLEWFPVEQMSVEAYTGVQSTVGYSWASRPDSKGSGWSVGLGTFTTGVRFRIYLVPKSPTA